MEQSLFRSYTEEEIINLINENKVEEDLRDLLISSINCRKNKIAKHLIDLNVPYDYLDKLQYDAYLMAVARGSTEIIKKPANILSTHILLILLKFFIRLQVSRILF